MPVLFVACIVRLCLAACGKGLRCIFCVTTFHYLPSSRTRMRTCKISARPPGTLYLRASHPSTGLYAHPHVRSAGNNFLCALTFTSHAYYAHSSSAGHSFGSIYYTKHPKSSLSQTMSSQISQNSESFVPGKGDGTMRPPWSHPTPTHKKKQYYRVNKPLSQKNILPKKHPTRNGSKRSRSTQIRNFFLRNTNLSA